MILLVTKDLLKISRLDITKRKKPEKEKFNKEQKHTQIYVDMLGKRKRILPSFLAQKVLCIIGSDKSPGF